MNYFTGVVDATGREQREPDGLELATTETELYRGPQHTYVHGVVTEWCILTRCVFHFRLTRTYWAWLLRRQTVRISLTPTRQQDMPKLAFPWRFPRCVRVQLRADSCCINSRSTSQLSVSVYAVGRLSEGACLQRDHEPPMSTLFS